jgi:hypothetical protein
MAVIVDGLPSGEASVWHHRGLLECEIGGLQRQLLVAGARKLGPRSAAGAVHLVTNAEARHRRADGFDSASEIRTGDRNLGRAESEAENAHQVWLAGHEMPGSAINASGDDTDENVVVTDRGFRYLPELQDVSGAVGILNDRLHEHHLAVTDNDEPVPETSEARFGEGGVTSDEAGHRA